MSSMSARDKKILMLIAPVVLVVAFWFLVLHPKRSEVASLSAAVATAQQENDDATAKAGTLEGAKANYARDYETVVRLGKAVPSTVDMPSLLVQLDSAAKGTHIKFASVKAGDRSAAPTPAATPTPAAGSTGSTPASSSSGGSSSTSTTPTPAPASGSTSTTPAPSGGSSGSTTATPPASGSTGASSSTSGTGTSGSGVQGLDSVPLDFTFTGSYFDLADFFHQMKRFVRMAGGNVQVKGRLLTIDSVKFDSTSFPKIEASVSATVYLTPKSEGTTAGGTASGPQGTTGSATPTPAASGGSTASTPTPSTGTSGGAPQ